MALMESNVDPQNSMPLIVTEFKGICMLFSLPTKEEGLPGSCIFAAFPEDKNLCVVQLLKEYEKRTEALGP